MDRRVDLLSTFITSPKAKLNEKINKANQTVLVKMFDVEYFKGLDSSKRQEIVSKIKLFIQCEYLTSNENSIIAMSLE